MCLHHQSKATTDRRVEKNSAAIHPTPPLGEPEKGLCGYQPCSDDAIRNYWEIWHRPGAGGPSPQRSQTPDIPAQRAPYTREKPIPGLFLPAPPRPTRLGCRHPQTDKRRPLFSRMGNQGVQTLREGRMNTAAAIKRLIGNTGE